MSPTRVVVDDDEQQIADLLKQVRTLRSRLATTAVKGTHDEFTAAATPATTYTLTYIPLTGTCLMALNGHVQREGTDYTCDYTTGIVTVSATQASGDRITFRYLVTDWLIARSLTPETSLAFTAVANNGGPAGTSDPTVAIPSSVVPGDTMIAAWSSFYAPGGDPAGWTRQLLTTVTGSTNALGFGCWTKTATSSDPGSTLHIPVGVSSDYWSAVVIAYGGGGIRSVTTATSGGSGVSSFATPTASATAGDMVVSLWGMEAATSGSLGGFTLDAAVTTRVTADDAPSVVAEFAHLGIGDEVAATTATTTARTASWTHGACNWAAVTFILKP